MESAFWRLQGDLSSEKRAADFARLLTILSHRESLGLSLILSTPIILTAPGISVDFVSRYFTTQSSIFEDPVTGSAHCSLIPFWSERLNKQNMVALQVSSRLGKLWCTNLGDRVMIAGEAITYMEGVIRTE